MFSTSDGETATPPAHVGNLAWSVAGFAGSGIVFAEIVGPERRAERDVELGLGVHDAGMVGTSGSSL